MRKQEDLKVILQHQLIKLFNEEPGFIVKSNDIYHEAYYKKYANTAVELILEYQWGYRDCYYRISCSTYLHSNRAQVIIGYSMSGEGGILDDKSLHIFGRASQRTVDILEAKLNMGVEGHGLAMSMNVEYANPEFDAVFLKNLILKKFETLEEMLVESIDQVIAS